MGVLRAASRMIVGIDVLILILLGFAFVFIESDSGTFVVATLTLVPTVLSLVGALVVLYMGWDPF